MDLAPDPLVAADTGPPAARRGPVLELVLDPGDARRLPRLLRGTCAPRASMLRLVWHDTHDFDLAANGRALLERRCGRRRIWRLERMVEETDALWLLATPLPVLGEGGALAELDAALPAPLVPMVRFVGRMRTFPTPEAVEVTLLAGTLHAAAATRQCYRAILQGPPGAVAELADRLAARLHFSVPATSLAGEALALAGCPAPRRRNAPPAAPPDRPVGEAFAYLVARFAGIILREAAQAGPLLSEPVHQMRITVRRLRSAIGLFERAVRCPELAAGKAGLRLLARTLGPARDWDVFTAGTGRAVAVAFAKDRAMQRLLNAAERRRLAAYAVLQHYLASAEFRRMIIGLVVLAASRPWETFGPAGDNDALSRAELRAGPLAAFAAHALERRLRRVSSVDGDIEMLPAEALHRLRLSGKRLRYAAEFFVPLFSGRGARRFVRRLATLQDRLGHLNDAAVAAHLMTELGGAHGYAGGVVHGFVAAHSADTRKRAGRAWRRFHRLDSFWG